MITSVQFAWPFTILSVMYTQRDRWEKRLNQGSKEKIRWRKKNKTKQNNEGNEIISLNGLILGNNGIRFKIRISRMGCKKCLSRSFVINALELWQFIETFYYLLLLLFIFVYSYIYFVSFCLFLTLTIMNEWNWNSSVIIIAVLNDRDEIDIGLT